MDATPAASVRRLPLEQRRQFYAARRYIPAETQKALGLHIKLPVYFKDPAVAREFPGAGLDAEYTVPWEPGLGHGPTSARFAVVDYDATTRSLAPPAQWDARADVFRGPGGEVLDQAAKGSAQFRQVSTWAVLQNTLDEFEKPSCLGRRIAWGFEGNRLIVVPHAGYGRNAYYDRHSKSLQFYYFDHAGERVYTCLSTDVVTHEFGHALLDGIRPYYLEAVHPQTAAFHEFVGDLTALLMVFRNNRFREVLASRTGGDLEGEDLLAGIAHQFGKAVEGSDYLRSAANNRTMEDFPAGMEPHEGSQVLTGAMFDILLELSARYRAREGRKTSVADALWNTVQRLQRMAVQALDLMPPVEGTFRDYALAVLRAELVADPVDPDGYRPMMIDAFVRRRILLPGDAEELREPKRVFERIPLTVFHDARDIGGSRGAAYRFVDDNRGPLFVPRDVDLVVADVFTAEKLGREGRRLPRQVVVQYVWREELVLEGARFGRYAGKSTGLLCGATLVLDEGGNVAAWARKPGPKPSGKGTDATKEARAGAKRRDRYLDALASRVAAGTVGEFLGSAAGLLAESVPSLAAREVGGSLRFELTPHLSCGHSHDDEGSGGRPWQPSS